ncbi:hypothetical protein DUNSADRAFT_4422 [Dunaliella salina]|uniref:Encoded protein n=1 Tax=Dunaliella salina TaxID=3046 RepID=A0ABQ7GS47_DUNSA|nr:hypothetical protein DUNSADRAFT_4422 [Dunaliella salina]|eukprot:KAF5837442.1 hypothetical protein DUNSADRAFT_4422 [Dunaliella salina]
MQNAHMKKSFSPHQHPINIGKRPAEQALAPPKRSVFTDHAIRQASFHPSIHPWGPTHANSCYRRIVTHRFPGSEPLQTPTPFEATVCFTRQECWRAECSCLNHKPWHATQTSNHRQTGKRRSSWSTIVCDRQKKSLPLTSSLS